MDTLKTPEVALSSHPGATSGTTPTVIGLDLSLTATGIAHCDGWTETIAAKRAAGDRRLDAIRNAVRHIASASPVELAVIEDLPTHAHGAGITGMVHGAVRVALMDLDVPYVLVPPATLKKYATGKGNATKPDMRMALFQRTGLDLRDDNQVDAWWLRAAGMEALGHPLVELPKAQREALAKVTWPVMSP